MEQRELAKQVKLVAAGDPDALQRLIVHHHATLRATVAAATDAAFRHRIDPDDVLQQAYISAFKALGDASGTGAAANARSSPGGRGSRRATSAAGASPADQNRARDQSPDREQNRDRKEAASSPPRFDEPAHFRNWLKRIALERLKDAQRALRRQKRDIGREVAARTTATTSYPNLIQRLAADDSTPSRRIAKDEAIAAVMSCLARLTDDQREVVRLRFLEDVPVVEIAKRLGKTDAAIYTLCHRGLKSLRALMVSITRYLTRL
jgi:RNA polymerase sigma factor (sigma-70 family)